jgi:hypothetical protein
MLKDFGLMKLPTKPGVQLLLAKSACLISGEGHLTILVIVFPPIKTLRSVEMSVQEDGLGLEISGYCSLDSWPPESIPEETTQAPGTSRVMIYT